MSGLTVCMLVCKADMYVAMMSCDVLLVQMIVEMKKVRKQGDSMCVCR